MEQKSHSEKRRIRKLWTCMNEQCRYVFGEMLTDNTVEIYGDRLNPKFTINFLRIKVRCPKCRTDQIAQSFHAADLAKLMVDDENRKLGKAPYDEDLAIKINREMHGAKSMEEMKAVFPEQEIVQETKLQNMLRQALKGKEQQAYKIMVDCVREGTPDRALLVAAIAKGTELPQKEGERLYDIVMKTISEIKNAHLKEIGGEEIGDDNWWHRV